jgi:hypothetical protein
VKKTTGFYPRPSVDTAGRAAVGQAGGVLLTSTVKAAGLDAGLSAALVPWRPVGATHDPAKVLLDLALTLALGGDTCSDLAVVRAEPAVFGSVASDPTLSRTITRLAADVDRVLAAQTTTPTPVILWSLTSTPPWSPRTPRRRTPSRRSRRASASTRCARSSTTGPPGPVNPWRSRCAPGTPGRTPPPTTSQ